MEPPSAATEPIPDLTDGAEQELRKAESDMRATCPGLHRVELDAEARVGAAVAAAIPWHRAAIAANQTAEWSRTNAPSAVATRKRDEADVAEDAAVAAATEVELLEDLHEQARTERQEAQTAATCLQAKLALLCEQNRAERVMKKQCKQTPRAAMQYRFKCSAAQKHALWKYRARCAWASRVQRRRPPPLSPSVLDCAPPPPPTTAAAPPPLQPRSAGTPLLF